ncbi:MAG: Holliday junction resolvase RuvX [Holosporales bacterium]|jgi:putative Holliday junction resolvase|nr:Holliday junction resolvase RuvX [Holosporales bacterium]
MNDEFRRDLIGKSRALCIDYGDRRIGIAISDIGWSIASPIEVIDTHQVFRRLFPLISSYEVSVIVIGFPVSLGGESGGAQAEKVKLFAEKLKELAENRGVEVQVIFWDERLSTKAAHRILSEVGATVGLRKRHVDKIAACFILQGFLEYVRKSP